MRGASAADQRRVQNGGGAVYMEDGTVTFQGNSTIVRAAAVHALLLIHTHAHASTCPCAHRHRRAHIDMHTH